MANGDTTLNSILKIWGPIVLILVAITAGTTAIVEGKHTKEHVRELVARIEKLEDTQKSDIKEIRKALGALQLQSAKICVTVGAKCD